MCRYRKSIFRCNHTHISALPILICLTEQQYRTGVSAYPCPVINTHGCSTVRVARDCEACEKRKGVEEATFAKLRERLAALRIHLNEAYGGCMNHVDEAGLKSEEEKVVEKSKGEKTESEESKEKEKKEKEESVAKFLKMKKSEKYADLMMLGV